MTHERDTLKAYFRMIAVHDPMRGNELVDALDAYFDVKFKREWQGLTDEEAFDAFGLRLWPESFWANASQELKATHEEAKKEVLRKARAIEAKLREKNND